MALSATISLNQSVAQINQPTLASLTISNSSGSSIKITSVTPTVVLDSNSAALDASSFSGGTVPFGPGYTSIVPANGSLVLQFSVCVFEPSLTFPSTVLYSVGANISASDGSYFSPTPATLTVTQVNFQDAT
jgi:hypothetical protein